ncbi:hypothetical protein B1L11_33955 [Microbispora sp. GKU 823]|nr:hypothetical protein B1L11_33955 [Microbispora sp. GKU 823]
MPVEELPEDEAERKRLFGTYRSNRSTPRPTRTLMARGAGHPFKALLDDCARRGRPPAVVFTILTRAQRVIRLSEPDGSAASWWLLALMEDDTARRVGWLRLRAETATAPPEDLIQEFDSYPLPEGEDALRDALTVMAMQTPWRPKTEDHERVLLLLGSQANGELARHIPELRARVAIDGVDLVVEDVPADSSTNVWEKTLHRALKLGGAVLTALTHEETSGWRIVEAIRRQHKDRRIIRLSPPEVWSVPVLLDLLRQHGVLPGLSARTDRRWPEAEPELRAGAAEDPRPAPSLQRTVHEAWLAKTGSGSNGDVLVPTAHRCNHSSRAWTRIRHGNAPKKYKGLQRYLMRLDPPGLMIRAKLCTHSGCGLVWLEYEVSVPAVDPDPDPDAANIDGRLSMPARAPPFMSRWP